MTQIQFPKYLRFSPLTITEAYKEKVQLKVTSYVSNLEDDATEPFEMTVERAKDITPLALTIIASIPLGLVLSPIFFIASIILPSSLTIPAVLTIGAVAHDIFDYIWDHLETHNDQLVDTKKLFSQRFTMLYFETSSTLAAIKNTASTKWAQLQAAVANFSC